MFRSDLPFGCRIIAAHVWLPVASRRVRSHRSRTLSLNATLPGPRESPLGPLSALALDFGDVGDRKAASATAAVGEEGGGGVGGGGVCVSRRRGRYHGRPRRLRVPLGHSGCGCGGGSGATATAALLPPPPYDEDVAKAAATAL